MAWLYTIRRGRPLSIAMRMTIWYVLSAFVLTFTSAGVLYIVLTRSLEQEDARVLMDNLNIVALLLRSSTPQTLPAKGIGTLTWGQLKETRTFVRVLNAQGRVLAETIGTGREVPMPGKKEHESLASARRAGRRIALLHQHNLYEAFGEGILGTGRDAAPVTIQIAMVRDYEERLLQHSRDKLWLVLGGCLLLTALAGLVITRIGMRPVEAIGRVAEGIGSSNLHERISFDKLPDELVRLADAFNGMLDRLERSFGRVTQFSNDAAHELRTPVSNLRGEIEVALARARTSDEYRELLGSCLEECSRISRIVDGLLFLARAEGGGGLHKQEVDVGGELSAVQEFYEPAATGSGITLRVISDGTVASLDRVLFQQAVGNLVSNALQHTPSDGLVELRAQAKDRDLEVTVRDTGAGIPADRLPYVFDRFYRVDQARSGSGHSLGLGLALVKSIAERHGGRAELLSQVGCGTTATLTFPGVVARDSAASTIAQPRDVSMTSVAASRIGHVEVPRD